MIQIITKATTNINGMYKISFTFVNLKEKKE